MAFPPVVQVRDVLSTALAMVAGFARVNVAVTVIDEFMVTVQVPVPEQPPPDHPVNVEPYPWVAVRVTGVPAAYDAEQVEPQFMPLGELVTVPAPVPDLETVRITEGDCVTVNVCPAIVIVPDLAAPEFTATE